MVVNGNDIRPGMRLSTGRKGSRYYAEVEVVDSSVLSAYFNGRVLDTNGEYYVNFAGSIHSCDKSAGWEVLSAIDPDAPD